MALVWIMIPGVGLFYSGLLRRKNALSMIWTSMVSIAVVSFQVRDSQPSTFPVYSLLPFSGSSGDSRLHSATQEMLSSVISVSNIQLA